MKKIIYSLVALFSLTLASCDATIIEGGEPDGAVTAETFRYTVTPIIENGRLPTVCFSRLKARCRVLGTMRWLLWWATPSGQTFSTPVRTISLCTLSIKMALLLRRSSK